MRDCRTKACMMYIIFRRARSNNAVFRARLPHAYTYYIYVIMRTYVNMHTFAIANIMSIHYAVRVYVRTPNILIASLFISCIMRPSVYVSTYNNKNNSDRQ